VTWRERSLVLGITFALVVTAFGFAYMIDPAKANETLVLIPTSFFAAGKFLPLWALSGENELGAYELGALIWAMDTFTVIMIVYSLEAFYGIHPFRRALDKVNGNAQLVLTAFPRMRKAAVVGIVLFVLFPVSGTGAVGASFIGVLLGMHRLRLIAAVSAGGFIGGMSMAFLTTHFGSALESFQAAQKDSTVKYLILAGLILSVLIVVVIANRAFKKAVAMGARERGSESGESG
jgi:uncharacterized membrane protein